MKFYSIVLVRLPKEYYNPNSSFVETKLCHISSKEQPLLDIQIKDKGKLWEGTRCYLELDKEQRIILENLLNAGTNTLAIRLDSYRFIEEELYVKPIPNGSDNWCISPAKNQWNKQYKDYTTSPVAIFQNYGEVDLKFVGVVSSLQEALEQIEQIKSNKKGNLEPTEYVLGTGKEPNIKFLNTDLQVLY